MTRPARAVFRAEVDHGTAELIGDRDRPQGWTLLIDGTAQSHVDLDDPNHLEFEYMRRIGHVVDLAAEPYAPLRALHLGGGAWTLARYVAATRPGSTQTVVELDRLLTEFVAHRLPADGLGIDVHVADARAALTATTPGSLDLVVLDVFSGARTPAHLTSMQFAALAARSLAPGGVYIANVADGGPALTFAGSQVSAARAAFRHVAVAAPPDVLRGRRFGNLVLAASAAPLPVDDLRRQTAADPFPARVVAGSDLDRRFSAEARTDRTATPSPLPPPGFWGQ
ncbi:MAG TPA: fused MFS/spermidine synthase [Pseudonocardia sp.]